MTTINPDPCHICGDTGWATLNTKTTIGQHTYDDGAAPCRWCPEGAARLKANPDLRTDYQLADVDPYIDQTTRREARQAYEQAKADVAMILARTPATRLMPPALLPTPTGLIPEAPGDTEQDRNERQQRSIRALNDLEQEKHRAEPPA